MIVNFLALEGFMSYRNRCELDFYGKHTISIAGRNSVGKSGLLRAIEYALYGQTHAKREVQLINDDAKRLIVQFTGKLHDGAELQIERGRTKKNEAILKVAGFRGKPSDVAQYIAEAIKLNHTDFVALSYFMQGDIHQFMSGSKREYFQRWTDGLRTWAQYEAQANSNAVELTDQIKRYQYKIDAAKSTIAYSSDLKLEARVAKRDVIRRRKAAKLVQDQVNELAVQIKTSEQSEQLKQALDTIVAQMIVIGASLADAVGEVDTVKRELKNLHSGRCPILDIACADLMGSREQLRGKIRYDLKAAKKKCLGLEEHDARLMKERNKLEATLAKATEPVEQTRAVHRQAKQDLVQANRELQKAATHLARVQAQIEAVDAAKTKIKTLTAKQDAAELELRRWQVLRFMCSRSGIPSDLIEGELVNVEDRCNWVLERLDYVKRIKFSGFTELAGFEQVCGLCGGETWHAQKCKACGAPRPKKRKDEPAITVIDGQNERPFELESGGAQVLQSFAVRLACSLFVSSMTGIPIQMIMLDEVFGMLDTANRQKLMSLVVDKLSTEFGLRQQFVVSHQADVINVVDDVLLVERTRGSSVVRWQ